MKHMGGVKLRRNITRMLFGIVFVLAAVALLGNSLQWWQITSFDGWWTVFLIVPGLAAIISYGFSLWGAALVLIGGWFLASEQNWIPDRVNENIIWIVLLLLVGLRLIFGTIRGTKVPTAPVILDGIKGANDSTSTINYTTVFGSIEVSNNSQSLCGGTVSAAFGAAKIDLRGAVPIDGAVVQADAIFGGVEILVPQNCRIAVHGFPFFGGGECKAVRSNDPSLPLLTIKYTSVFGGVEVK